MTEAPSRLIGVDVGGTFTDVVAIDEDGRVRVAKVPTNLASSDRSVLQGAEEVGVALATAFNVASTAGLNAVITRNLPKVAFLTTLGHRDILDKGRGWRPFEYLTDPSWRRGFSDASRPLVPRYLRRGIEERIGADGRVLLTLNEDEARAVLRVMKRCNVEGVAICLLHAWVNPAHEIRLRELVREELGPDVMCSLSSDVSPLAKEYPRASTTTVDVLMKIKYTDYTARLQSGLDDLGFQGRFNYADCSAMLIPASLAIQRPHRIVVGGPAAGTVSSAHFGSYIGRSNLLCGDVGGTSCDISVVLDGKPWVDKAFELEWDLVVNTLSTKIVTLGAGGGSIVSVGSEGQLLVGPGSAGAEPGPACYGNGGTNPTMTDTALLIGILATDRFLGGTMTLDDRLALKAFEGLDTVLPLEDRIRHAWGIGLNNIAEGLLEMSISRGIDVRDFSLVAFGAAGPMMLPGLLDLLPLESVIVPPNPGAFSALGLVSADRVFSESRTLYGVLSPEIAPKISELFETLEQEILLETGLERSDVRVVRSFDGRLRGQGFETPFVSVPDGEVTADTIQEMVTQFHDEYEKRSGTRFQRFGVEGVTYRVQVVVPSDKVDYPVIARGDAGPATPVAMRTLRWLYDGEVQAGCYERDQLRSGDLISGPAIIQEQMSTTFVPFGHNASVGDHGEIIVV